MGEEDGLIYALVGIGILPGDHHDVADIRGRHCVGLCRRPLRQEGLGAHVVVDQGASKSRCRVVGQRSVQQVSIEEHDGAGLGRHHHAVLIRIGEIH